MLQKCCIESENADVCRLSASLLWAEPVTLISVIYKNGCLTKRVPVIILGNFFVVFEPEDLWEWVTLGLTVECGLVSNCSLYSLYLNCELRCF